MHSGFEGNLARIREPESPENLREQVLAARKAALEVAIPAATEIAERILNEMGDVQADMEMQGRLVENDVGELAFALLNLETIGDKVYAKSVALTFLEVLREQ